MIGADILSPPSPAALAILLGTVSLSRQLYRCGRGSEAQHNFDSQIDTRRACRVAGADPDKVSKPPALTIALTQDVLDGNDPLNEGLFRCFDVPHVFSMLCEFATLRAPMLVKGRIRHSIES